MEWRASVLASVASLVALAASARASEPPLRALTLSEALAYARANQPELRAAVARLRGVETDAEVVRARWKPTFVATAQILATTTNNTTGSYVSVPGFDNPRVSATRAEGSATASFAPSPSTLAGVGGRQEVYDFGRISAAAAAADLRADAQRFSLASTRLVVDYDVEESYFAVYAAKAVLSASEKAYARAAVHRDMARAGVDTGLRRPIELTRAEAVLDQYDLDRIKGARGVAVAQSVLAAAVGLDAPRVDIVGEPPAPRDVPTLDGLMGVGLARNPDLLAAVARIRAQEQETRAVGAELRPNLYLTGAISGNAGGATPSSGETGPEHGLLPAVPNWDVGLVLSWPLFDSTVTTREDRSRVEEQVAREDATAERQKLVAAIEEAYLDVQAARDALPVLHRAMDAAVANYDQANARFNVGLGNAVELADAEELRTRAEIELAIGTFEIARARAALARVIAEDA
jgi:outer membrane protein TolC